MFRRINFAFIVNAYCFVPLDLPHFGDLAGIKTQNLSLDGIGLKEYECITGENIWNRDIF